MRAQSGEVNGKASQLSLREYNPQRHAGGNNEGRELQASDRFFLLAQGISKDRLDKSPWGTISATTLGQVETIVRWLLGL